jgi:hypothetical protein
MQTLNEEILGTYVLCPSPYRVNAMLIGPVEVGWFSVTHATWELNVYYSAITIRIMDGVMCSNMTWKFTPSMLIKVDKVAVCGSGG